VKREQRAPDIESPERLAYRLKEVEALIGIPVSTLRTMIRNGDLNPCTGFGTWLITREELQRLLQKRLRSNV
jgi:hypothetical protein